MWSTKDISGFRNDRVVAIRHVGFSPHGKALWECKCDCGTIFTAIGSNLTSRSTKSCGCRKLEALHRRNFKHGMRHHPIYKSWCHMKERCLNPKMRDYRLWGGRGITICERWLAFSNFSEDMLPTWKSGMEIDRRDNSGNYEPGNCRWVTSRVNSNNKRTNVFVSGFGQRHTVAEWSSIFGCSYAKLYHHLKMGRPLEGFDSTSHGKPTTYPQSTVDQIPRDVQN